MARDKILIKDLLVRGYIGFQPWEIEKKQDICINLTSLYPRAPRGRDSVADALNDKTITKQIIAYVEDENTRHYPFVELLATAIARICIEGGADAVRVRVEKPGALRFARSVGVEIECTREDFAGILRRGFRLLPGLHHARLKRLPGAQPARAVGPS